MAGPDFQAIGQNITESIQRMTGPQRLTLGLAFFATIMSVFFVANATGGTPMSALYADIEPETAAAVTTELDARGVSYELLGNGRIINVPADQVHQLRLDMAAIDLPGGSDGWNLLDNQSITATSGDRTIAYQRAMQGELAKTISVIDGVSSATVHLVIPERDILVDDGKQASFGPACHRFIVTEPDSGHGHREPGGVLGRGTELRSDFGHQRRRSGPGRTR